MTDGQGSGRAPNVSPPPYDSSTSPSPSKRVPSPPAGMPQPTRWTDASGRYDYGDSEPTSPHIVRPRAPSSYRPRLRSEHFLGIGNLLAPFARRVHHFYLGKVGREAGYLLTFGWLAIGLLVDLTLPCHMRRINGERQEGLR